MTVGYFELLSPIEKYKTELNLVLVSGFDDNFIIQFHGVGRPLTNEMHYHIR
jgi:uncharacterized protein YdeI (YjbR/CyaY-like superfamily)